MNEAMVKAYFEYARERYLIRHRRMEGQPKPWTQDPVLQAYRFCNVFREDDKVTEWFRRNVRGPMRCDRRVVFNTILFRFINSIEMGELLLKGGLFNQYRESEFASIMKLRKDSGKPMLGAAYMIKTPNGVNKITGLRQVFRPFDGMGDSLSLYTSTTPTMQELVEWLCHQPYMGPFMAYEIACDLQYTEWFSPTDTMTWANPGPGAKRGLTRLMNCSGHLTNNFSTIPMADMQTMMRKLLDVSWNVHFWPGHWPHWDMRTVEHTLCEWDKYMRAKLGEGTPKQKFGGV